MPELQTCTRTAGCEKVRRRAAAPPRIVAGRVFALFGESARPADATARLVQLSEPTADGIVEYLEMPGLEPLSPGAFAMRVDGNNMTPRIRNGDLVVCRHDVAPQPGLAAVVKVRGRIGCTVKLWRPEGDHVHLIAFNDSYSTCRLARMDIVWACRVLWVVRFYGAAAERGGGSGAEWAVVRTMAPTA
jgi:hypothetical protein